MATHGCSSAQFIDVCEDAFCFEVSEHDGDVDEDIFRKSSQCKSHFIRSKDNKFLVLNGDKFETQNLTIHQQGQSGSRFSIQNYISSSFTERQGRVAMLYADKGSKKMVACCRSDGQVYPEEMVLPKKIEKDAHKALFYLIKLNSGSDKYMFQSAMYQSKYLAFETVEFVDKLVLRHKEPEEVDANCEIQLS